VLAVVHAEQLMPRHYRFADAKPLPAAGA
jgi:hypothetical protein